MCKSVAQQWRAKLYPDRWHKQLHAICDAMTAASDRNLMPAVSSDSMPQPSHENRETWNRQLLKFHKAAGHPNRYNLARIVKDAAKADWQVRAAFELKCDDCAALKPGGSSSGAIPPASMRPLPKAWEAVGLDTFEWLHGQLKHKVVVFMDLATKFKVSAILRSYEKYTVEMENSQMLLDCFARLWLADKPKPLTLIPDNAKTMVSQHMRDTLSQINISLETPAAKESWAHGLVERAVQELKEVSGKMTLSYPDLLPSTVLALATHALNATEHVHGYTPMQWAYGKQFAFSGEDLKTWHDIDPHDAQRDFTQLMQSRQHAEDVARKLKATLTLTRLKNSKVRQPLRQFQPTELVKIWRKYTQDGGKRGGLRRVGRAQWLGPGRVVFHETIPGQHPDDPRKPIVWVVIGGTMHRASVHSVRPVTERERFDYEMTHPESIGNWKTLADMIPQRSYTDLVSEERELDEEEQVDLPPQPNSDTAQLMRRPLRRLHVKTPESVVHQPANVYEEAPARDTPVAEADEDPDEGLGSGVPSQGDLTRATSLREPLLTSRSEPDSKRARTSASQPSELDLDDAVMLESRVPEELLFTCLEESVEGYVLDIDIEPRSQRERQKLQRHPSLYLVQKMRDCEVRFEKLRPEHKVLFNRAKAKEVNSFISNNAVRKCLSEQEAADARSSNRIIRCRWVLTWKPTPDESLAEAQQEVREQPEKTCLTSDGRRKAKAIIVLLGLSIPTFFLKRIRRLLQCRQC